MSKITCKLNLIKFVGRYHKVQCYDSNTRNTNQTQLKASTIESRNYKRNKICKNLHQINNLKQLGELHFLLISSCILLDTVALLLHVCYTQATQRHNFRVCIRFILPTVYWPRNFLDQHWHQLQQNSHPRTFWSFVPIKMLRQHCFLSTRELI